MAAYSPPLTAPFLLFSLTYHIDSGKSIFITIAYSAICRCIIKHFHMADQIIYKTVVGNINLFNAVKSGAYVRENKLENEIKKDLSACQGCS